MGKIQLAALFLVAVVAFHQPALADKPSQSSATTVILPSSADQVGVERTISPGQDVIKSRVAVQDAFITDHDIRLTLGDISYTIPSNHLIFRAPIYGMSKEGVYDDAETYCERTYINSYERMAVAFSRDIEYLKSNFDINAHLCLIDSDKSGNFNKAIIFGAKRSGKYGKIFDIERIKYDISHDLVLPNVFVGVRYNRDGKTFAMYVSENAVDLGANDFWIMPDGKKMYEGARNTASVESKDIYFCDVFFRSQRNDADSTVKINIIHGFNRTKFFARHNISHGYFEERFIDFSVY